LKIISFSIKTDEFVNNNLLAVKFDNSTGFYLPLVDELVEPLEVILQDWKETQQVFVDIEFFKAKLSDAIISSASAIIS